MPTAVRKKVKLAFIVNDVARKISYEKRKKSILKKLAELTTLCGIQACAVVDSKFETHAEVWPSPREFVRLVTKYRNVPANMQNKKTLNQESYLMQMIQKTQKQLAKMKRKNKDKKMTFLIFQSLFQTNVMFNPNMVDLQEMIWLINYKLEKVNSRMSALDKMDFTNQAAVPNVADAEAGHGEKAQVDNDQRFDTNMVAMENEPWFMNLFNNDGGIEMVPFGDVINFQN